MFGLRLRSKDWAMLVTRAGQIFVPEPNPKYAKKNVREKPHCDGVIHRRSGGATQNAPAPPVNNAGYAIQGKRESLSAPPWVKQPRKHKPPTAKPRNSAILICGHSLIFSPPDVVTFAFIKRHGESKCKSGLKRTDRMAGWWTGPLPRPVLQNASRFRFDSDDTEAGRSEKLANLEDGSIVTKMANQLP